MCVGEFPFSFHLLITDYVHGFMPTRTVYVNIHLISHVCVLTYMLVDFSGVRYTENRVCVYVRSVCTGKREGEAKREGGREI